MVDIKRFHVRDGYVLDEHPEGSVVRYDRYVEAVNKLEDQLRVSEAKRMTERAAADYWQEAYHQAVDDYIEVKTRIERFKYE